MNRLMSLTSVFILTSCMIIMGCFASFIYNANINLEQIDNFNKIVFIIDKEFSTQEQIDKIKEEIMSLPNVGHIRHISRDDALDITFDLMQNTIEISEGLVQDLQKANVDGTLMHDSIEIEYKDINDLDTLIYQLWNVSGVEDIKNKTEIAEFIKSLKNVVMFVLVWFLAILFAIAIFIILNTVKLSVHSRKNEIIIMRYIGATNFFILLPFLLEGVIIGLVSGIVAYFIQLWIYNNALNTLENMQTGLKFADFSDLGGILFLAFILVGMICGFLGSGISSHRYLKA